MPKTKKSEAKKRVHDGQQSNDTAFRFQAHLALKARGYGVMGGQGGSGSGDKPGPSAPAERVPVGWQRVIEGGAVVYISPSGTVLSSVEEVRMYLLTDGTCKCGLECPLVVHKVFCFDPRAEVLGQGQEPWRAGQDMTKLCNHRRKVVAMAALCHSMQVSQHSFPGQHSGAAAECRDPGGMSLKGQEMKEHTPYSAGLHSSVHPRHSPGPAPCRGNGSSPQVSVSLPSNGSLPLFHLNTNSCWSTGTPRKPVPVDPARSPFSSYGMPQRCPRFPTSQNQRPPHTLEPPNSPSRVALGAGRVRPGHQVGSPPPHHHLHPSSSAPPFSDLGAAAVYSTGSRSSCPPLSPLPLIAPGGSPKILLPSASPCRGAEGVFQQDKDSSNDSTVYPSQTHAHQNNQSTFSVPSPRGRTTPGPTLGSGSGGTGGMQNQQQQHTATFPASSLLSAAAKAQLAYQNQNQSNDTNPGCKETHQTKVIMSTLQSSHSSLNNSHSVLHNSHPALHNSHSPLQNSHSPSSRVPTIASPYPCSSLAPLPPPNAPPLASQEKVSCIRQHSSPIVLSVLKEPRPSALSVSHSSSSPSTSSSTSDSSHPHPENHLHHLHLSVTQPSPLFGSCHVQKSSPIAAPPLSALLHMLSVQSAQAASATQATPVSAPITMHTEHGHTDSSPGLPIGRPAQYDAQPSPSSPATHLPPHTQRLAPPTEAPPTSPAPQDITGETEPSPSSSAHRPCNAHGSTTSSAVILLGPEDLSNNVLGIGPDRISITAAQQNYTANGLFQMADAQSSSGTKTPDTHSSGTSPPPLATPGDTAGDAPGDAPGPLQLAESFPFMTQDQLLQLLSAAPGLPSLLAPPLLGSLPIGVWVGGQQGQTPPPQQQLASLLNHDPQGNALPSVLATQGDLPVNFLGILNSSPPAVATPDPTPNTALLSGLPPAPAPNLAPGPGVDLYEKPSLQALLLASLLLSQQAGPVLPLGPLNMDLLLQQQQQQHFPPFLEGSAVEKDSLLSGPLLLEALHGMIPPTEGALQGLQSLLPPPAFLSLSPALLSAALAAADSPHSPPPPQQPHPQETLESSSLASMPGSAPELADLSVTSPGQDKSSPLPTPLLPTVLAPGVLGDLAGLSNISGFHSLLGAGPLLLPPMPTPGLGVPLIPGQGAGLNPLTCLLNTIQLNVGPSLTVGEEKQLQESASPTPQEENPANQLSQEPLPSPAEGQKQGGSAGVVLNPYASFMDTIYTSFLQVSSKRADNAAGAHSALPSTCPSAQPPAPPGAPPSFSPRRACSLRNPELSRLSMEAAQSPARGTPKPSEDHSSTPPLSRAGDPRGCSHVPLLPAFLEEAKTDRSSHCPYSNELPSGGASGGQREGRPCSQGSHSPGNQDSWGPEARGPPDLGVGAGVQMGGARRGRKRRHVLQGALADSNSLASRAAEETRITTELRKAERSMKARRRRVFR